MPEFAVGDPASGAHAAVQSASENPGEVSVQAPIALIDLSQRQYQHMVPARSVFERYNIVSPGDLRDAADRLDAAARTNAGTTPEKVR